MRAGLAQREPETLARWETMRLYERMLEQRARRAALPASRRAAVRQRQHPPRSRAQQSSQRHHRQVPPPCRPACSLSTRLGLPRPADRARGREEPRAREEGALEVEVRKLCADYATKFVDVQRKDFIRLGVIGEWERPYLTMEYAYEATEVRELAQFVIESGALYRGRKPVHWCASCRTALAEAEVEYAERRSTSRSTSPFRVERSGGPSRRLRGAEARGRDLDDHAVDAAREPRDRRASRDHEYALVEAPGGRSLVVAEALLEAPVGLRKTLGLGDVLATLPGTRARGREGAPSLARPRVADHVSAITSRSTPAPGSFTPRPGTDRKTTRSARSTASTSTRPSTRRGRFTAEVPEYAGRPRLRVPTPTSSRTSRRPVRCSRACRYDHSYPHCWRCKNPMIFRATEQWFISMEHATTCADRALARSDCDRCHDVDSDLGSRSHRRHDRGSSGLVPVATARLGRADRRAALHLRAISRPPTRGSRATSPTSSRARARTPGSRGRSSGSCRRDSRARRAGTSVRARARHPRRLVRLGRELRRGRREATSGPTRSPISTSRAATSIAAGSRAASHVRRDARARAVQGRAHARLHPRRGRPQDVEVARQRGGAAEDRQRVTAPTSSASGSPPRTIATTCGSRTRSWSALAESYRRIRNTARYLLAQPLRLRPHARHALPTATLELDRLALDRLRRADRALPARLRRLRVPRRLPRAQQLLQRGPHRALLRHREGPALLRARPHRASGARRRRRCTGSSSALARLMAPILSFTAEEIWRGHPGPSCRRVCLLTDFPEARDKALAEPKERGTVRNSRTHGPAPGASEPMSRTTLEEKRKSGEIGQSLEAKVRIHVLPEDFTMLSGFPAGQLAATVHRVARRARLRADARRTDASRSSVQRPDAKCARCWNWLPSVGTHADHPELCDRCHARRGRGVMNLLPALALALGVIGLDRADQGLDTREPRARRQSIQVLPGFFSIVYVRNTGAAFGICWPPRCPRGGRSSCSSSRASPSRSSRGVVRMPREAVVGARCGGRGARRRARQPYRPDRLRRGHRLPRRLRRRLPLAGVQRRRHGASPSGSCVLVLTRFATARRTATLSSGSAALGKRKGPHSRRVRALSFARSGRSAQQS